MKFIRYQDKNGEYRWRLVAANGEPIANGGEGYKNARDCDHAVALLKSTNKETPYVMG